MAIVGMGAIAAFSVVSIEAMPRLACWSCGRVIYAVAPLESLFAEERRCPRCGAFLNGERREDDRRTAARRVNPTDDPGPPKAKERREEERRQKRRRKPADGTQSTAPSNEAGWSD
jgi:hypothetical protein